MHRTGARRQRGGRKWSKQHCEHHNELLHPGLLVISVQQLHRELNRTRPADLIQRIEARTGRGLRGAGISA